jgi:hypothetical protein
VRGRSARDGRRSSTAHWRVLRDTAGNTAGATAAAAAAAASLPRGGCATATRALLRPPALLAADCHVRLSAALRPSPPPLFFTATAATAASASPAPAAPPPRVALVPAGAALSAGAS